jgi:preprotein translocase subunit YajC|tara:strand:+ start:4657 stop:4971 length:315 start_codon:yes stop_codon:yes gene_type:complete
MKAILLEAAGPDWKLMAMMGLVFVVMYFFMIRPQKKKEKELAKLRDEIKSGDEIVTAGGIHGKVMVIAETTVTVSVESQAKLKIEKSSIAIINGVGSGVAADKK